VLGDDWFFGQVAAAALGRGSGGSRSTSKAADTGGVGLRSGRAAGLRGFACLETGARVERVFFLGVCVCVAAEGRSPWLNTN
jgi:hypothetical protein